MTGLVSATEPARAVVDALAARGMKPRGRDGAWTARCPGHDDRQASLSVGRAADGKVLLRCHAGCTYDAIIGALGFTRADLRPADGAGGNGMVADFSPARAGHTAHLNGGAPEPAPDDWPVVAAYEYTTADGAPVFVVERKEPPGQPADGPRRKTFTQRRADGGAVKELTWRPLYRLPRVRDAIDRGAPVLLVEGEKDVHTAEALGHVATTHAGGATNWRPEYAEQLEGANVVLLPDNDKPGHQWALRAAAALVAHGARVSLLALPDVGDKGDLSDWCAARGGPSPDAAAALAALLHRATPWRVGDPVPPPPARSRFRVLSDVELEALPPPTWLLDGLVPANALAALIGHPGAGKSFVALDLAASVAAGRACLGRPVLAGSVLYCAAEGTAGLPQRVSAWKHAAGLASASVPLFFVTEPLNLFTPDDVLHVVRACEQITSPDAPVRLVVIDTLARAMAGGEENSAKDVGLVIEHAERVRRATGATVLLVHHTKKEADTERGSSALRGAMDTILLVKADDPDAAAGAKLLVVDKQKDAAPADPVVFTLDPVAADTAHGRVQSCRVLRLDVRWTDAVEHADAPLSRTQLDALRTLRDVFGPAGATATEWMDATGLPKKTFYRARAALDRAGLVLAGHGRGSRYQPTRRGLDTLAHPARPVGVTPLTPSDTNRDTRSPSPPLGGGEGTTSGVSRPVSVSRPGAPHEPPADWLTQREFSDEEAPW